MDEVTVAVADVPATAAGIVRDGDCTAQCLVASSAPNVACGCPCKGKWHGALGDVPVPGTRRQPKAAPVDEPALFDVVEFGAVA